MSGSSDAAKGDPARGEVDGVGDHNSGLVELELELIQSHMAQKPVLRGEVGCACVAREVSVERGGVGERGCARRLDGWLSGQWQHLKRCGLIYPFSAQSDKTA